MADEPDWRITGPNGEPYPDFAEMDLRRDLPDLPPLLKQALRDAMCIPPWRGALQGTQVNSRGQSVEVGPGEFKNILDLRPLGEDSDVITVCWGITPVGVVATDNPGEVFLRGLLEWGVGSSNYTAEIDICQGLIVSIPASFVRAGVRYEQPAYGGGVPPSYRVNASLAYGYIGQRSGQARFTDRLLGPAGTITVAPGDIAESNIPPFATAFTIVSGAPVGGALGIAFAPCAWELSAGGGIQSGGTVTTGANTGSQVESTFPIFNSAHKLRIENTGPAAAFYQVIYSLSL